MPRGPIEWRRTRARNPVCVAPWYASSEPRRAFVRASLHLAGRGTRADKKKRSRKLGVEGRFETRKSYPAGGLQVDRKEARDRIGDATSLEAWTARPGSTKRRYNRAEGCSWPRPQDSPAAKSRVSPPSITSSSMVAGVAGSSTPGECHPTMQEQSECRGLPEGSRVARLWTAVRRPRPLDPHRRGAMRRRVQ